MCQQMDRPINYIDELNFDAEWPSAIKEHHERFSNSRNNFHNIGDGHGRK